MQGVLEDKKRKYHCYYELTLDIIGGKWEPIILYHISKHAIMSYGELINIPHEETVSVIIAYGYEESHPKARQRKNISEIVRYLS